MTPDAARHDIDSRDDVETLVRAFYRDAFQDDLIGRIFTDVAHMDLEAHLPIMCDFWETVLFRAGLYRRNALDVHFSLHRLHPLTRDAFDRWLEIWGRTVDRLFLGERAERAKLQAERIAGSMHRRVTGRNPSDLTHPRPRNA